MRQWNKSLFYGVLWLMFLELDKTDTAAFAFTGDFLAGRLRHNMASGDLAYIESMVTGERTLSDQQTLVRRGDLSSQCALLVSGFMFRTVNREKRRSIVAVHVPGDFVDLHCFALKRLDHNIVASGTARLAIVPHQALELAMAERPRIARSLWFATLLDAAIHRKWIEMLEQLDAPRRIAHIYCELQTRQELIGRARPCVLRAPFTQTDLAAMCGISAVHANRAISKLREIELAEIRRGTLYTSNWAALREYAQFDASYLYGDGALRLSEAWD